MARLKCDICGSRDFYYDWGRLGVFGDPYNISVLVRISRPLCTHGTWHLRSDYVYHLWEKKYRLSNDDLRNLKLILNKRVITERELVDFILRRGVFEERCG